MAQASERASSEAPGPDEDNPRSTGQPAHDVFVSYSNDDKPVADDIVSRLEQAGVRCWVAPRDAIPGEFFGKSIMDAIETSRLMVVVLSKESNRSPYVLREVGCAVKNDVMIIPFRIETVEPTGAMAFWLSGNHWLGAMTPPLDFHIANLVKVMQRLLERDSTELGPLSPPDRKSWGQRHRLVVGLIAAASLAILGTVLALLLVSSGRQQPNFVTLDQLAPGDCLQVPQQYATSNASRLHSWTDNNISWPTTMPVVPCGQPHSGEVFFADDPWSVQQPFPRDINQQVHMLCANAFMTYVGVFIQHIKLELYLWGPERKGVGHRRSPRLLRRLRQRR